MGARLYLIVALQFEARAARQLVPDYRMSITEGRGATEISWTIDRGNRSPNSYRCVHQAAVVTYKQIALLDQSRDLFDRCFTRGK